MPAAQQHIALPPRYRVVRHIANGGMASVWAAEDSILERLVAVKVLAPGYAADPSARRRFTREARAAARVSDHPHVATVFDIGETSDAPTQAFIVMEHLAGGTVADRLRRDEPVPLPAALRWLREAASALDAAHAADIVHRDVKPGNLLLDENGRLAVGDFGIASIAGDTAVTQAGQVLGTAAYLSPEQARGNPATPASDRYSLAVVAYELLCGTRPFGGDTPVAQARAHIEVDPPAPSGPCEGAAEALRRGLAKDPAQRPPSAAAFVADLEQALGARGEPTRVTALGPGRAAPAGPSSARPAGPRFGRPEPERVARREPTPPPLAPVASRRRGGGRGARALAAVTVLALVAGVAAAFIGGGSSDQNRGARRSSATAPQHKAKHAAPTPRATPPAPVAGPPAALTPNGGTSGPGPAANDGRSAATLNNTGYAMLSSDPHGALPLLQRAVEKFRAQGDTSSVDYAYSLYNLGMALRLTGHPSAAIPYLVERLRISNDRRGLVAQELRAAQQQAGQPSTGGGRKHWKSQGD